MPGQIWSSNAAGGYLYSDNLSDYLRFELQSMTKFRNLAEPKADAIGLHNGDTYRWNRYSSLATRGGPIGEQQKMPETSFTIGQASLTIQEFGNSVPYTGLLEALGEHDVKDIIDQTLKDDARKVFDRMVAYQFFQTPLRFAPTGGNSATAITLSTGGSTAITNALALGTGHVKAIVDVMAERNVPAFKGGDYACVTHPTTLRGFKNTLETLNQYTETGLQIIFSGEVGRYEGVRFIQQTEVPKGHANDAAFNVTSGSVNNIYTASDDAWNGGLSSWAFFFGADTVIEAASIPEEIRAKLPGDYGRDKGIAYYYLGQAGLTHADATNARIFMWDSAA
jgi:N4-gp56 family major capsid protein